MPASTLPVSKRSLPGSARSPKPILLMRPFTSYLPVASYRSPGGEIVKGAYGRIYPCYAAIEPWEAATERDRLTYERLWTAASPTKQEKIRYLLGTAREVKNWLSSPVPGEESLDLRPQVLQRLEKLGFLSPLESSVGGIQLLLFTPQEALSRRRSSGWDLYYLSGPNPRMIHRSEAISPEKKNPSPSSPSSRQERFARVYQRFPLPPIQLSSLQLRIFHLHAKGESAEDIAFLLPWVAVEKQLAIIDSRLKRPLEMIRAEELYGELFDSLPGSLPGQVTVTHQEGK